MAELPGGFQQHDADLAELGRSKGAQLCTDASPTTMSHFRPLWSGLGGWPPASWSSPPSLTISLSFPHLIHFSLSLLFASLFPLSSVSMIRFENDGKTGRKSPGRGAELVERRAVHPETWAPPVLMTHPRRLGEVGRPSPQQVPQVSGERG